jgi:peptidoglycan-associated lipoprotein
MEKRKLLLLGLVALFIGCGQQPELDVNEDANNTTPTPKVEKNVTQPVQETNTTPDEADLTDTTVLKVTEDSIDTNEDKVEEKLNQNLGVALSKEVVHFDFDKYNIRADQMPIVESVANLLKDAKGNFTVRIEGNCDEWGSDEYNYALGLKRANTVKKALIDLGVDANKLTIISYGESNPVCTAHTRECWAKNRRDNFTLLP